MLTLGQSERVCLIQDHLAWCRFRNLRASYVNEIRMTLTRVEREIGSLEHATEEALSEWWASLRCGAGTKNAYLAHVSGFYRFLSHQRIRHDDPTSRLVRPRQVRGLPRPIDEGHLTVALQRATDPIRTWLALAAFCGFRAHEIAGLHGEDIRTDRLFVRDGKGGKQRVVPAHPSVIRLLEGSPRNGPVFTNAYGDALTANTVSQRSNRLLHRLGFPETIHTLRHYFGTTIYGLSQDIRLTQELMGHSSPTVTAVYAAWNNEAAASVVGKLKLAEVLDSPRTPQLLLGDAQAVVSRSAKDSHPGPLLPRPPSPARQR